MTTAARAQAGRNRARDNKLRAARERRLRLDPEQVARDKRIDEATVDVEVALEARGEAQREVDLAEVAAATAVERLLHEGLSVRDVIRLTGLDQATVRRLRRVKEAVEVEDGPEPRASKGSGALSDTTANDPNGVSGN